MGDHERGLPSFETNAPDLVLQRAARQQRPAPSKNSSISMIFGVIRERQRAQCRRAVSCRRTNPTDVRSSGTGEAVARSMKVCAVALDMARCDMRHFGIERRRRRCRARCAPAAAPRLWKITARLQGSCPRSCLPLHDHRAFAWPGRGRRECSAQWSYPQRDGPSPGRTRRAASTARVRRARRSRHQPRPDSALRCPRLEMNLSVIPSLQERD